MADDTAEDIAEVASDVDVSLPLEQAAALSTAIAPTASVAARWWMDLMGARLPCRGCPDTTSDSEWPARRIGPSSILMFGPAAPGTPQARRSRRGRRAARTRPGRASSARPLRRSRGTPSVNTGVARSMSPISQRSNNGRITAATWPVISARPREIDLARTGSGSSAKMMRHDAGRSDTSASSDTNPSTNICSTEPVFSGGRMASSRLSVTFVSRSSRATSTSPRPG